MSRAVLLGFAGRTVIGAAAGVCWVMRVKWSCLCLGMLLMGSLCCGCRSFPPGHYYIGGTTQIDGVVSGIMASDSHTFALLLVDWNGVGWDKVGGETAGGGGSGPEGEFSWSEYRLNDGTKLKWYMSTPDGRTGPVIINDRHYDLATGPLFLLTKRGNEVEVEQVHVDLFNIKPDPAALAVAVRANGRARTFLSKAIKNNPLPPLAAR